MLSSLRSQLSNPDSLISDPTGYESYLHDATTYRAVPAGILIANQVEDIRAAVKFCRRRGIAVTMRGAGTGLSGGCVAAAGALVISTERMTSVQIDAPARRAICEPGVITKQLQDDAARYGLFYPPDPASLAECTLGGNVAEGAGGLRCKRFGVTKDYVIGLEAVTAEGELLKTGVFNDNCGLSIGDVLIASEGTLAIITRIAVRLIPIPPRGITILAAFPHMRNAAQTVTDITTAGIVPTVMEFIDGAAAEASNRYEKTSGLEKAGAILLLETSGEDAVAQLDAIDTMCRQNNAALIRTEPDPARAETLWAVRRNVSKAIKAMAAYAVSEDVVVPNSRFPDLVEFVAERNSGSPLIINSFGHAGDGNLHVYYASTDGSEHDRRLIDQEITRLMRKTLEFGGTITGEHGVGLAKRDFLCLEFDAPTLGVMRAIKEVLDPSGLLNPDKLFPPAIV